MMQVSVGEFIRQLRRQHSLTQTELGGEQFSKSYVSAVERDKIIPSHEALRFFATQLHQPSEILEQLLAQSEHARQNAQFGNTHNAPHDEQVDQEVIGLLDLVLQGKNLQTVSRLTPDRLAAPTLDLRPTQAEQKQARYALLVGLQKQKKDELLEARTHFEYALALAPLEYQPTILDALGTNYYLAHAYESALTYHERALTLLKRAQEPDTDLFLRVELHCAHDYSMLSAHQQASQHYERARHYLRTNHNIEIAGELYPGLGYSLYASLFQMLMSPSIKGTDRPSNEQVERTYQLALGFLLQSRMLYQLSNNQQGEYKVRLMQAMMLLDFCKWRVQVALERMQDNGKNPFFVNCANLLDEAQEQCRQVLLARRGATPGYSDSKQEVVLYLAQAYLVRVFTYRAVIARMGGYTDTGARERAQATSRCQQVLYALQEATLPDLLVQEMANAPTSAILYHAQALPHLPRLDGMPPHHPMVLTEVYFAAGEVAEELGRATGSPDYAQECYQSADHFFQEAIKASRQETPEITRDSSYAVRLYQRYLFILEQRLKECQDNNEMQQKLLALLKDVVTVFQMPPRGASERAP